jgi:hypothetical protein
MKAIKYIIFFILFHLLTDSDHGKEDGVGVDHGGLLPPGAHAAQYSQQQPHAPCGRKTGLNTEPEF